MKKTENLQQFRKRIWEIDDEILSSINERMEYSQKVGEYKRAHGLPIKDYGVEKQIIDKVRRKATNFGLHEDLCEQLFKTIIEYSCFIQDALFKNRPDQRQEGKREILIVGGFGLMGRWLAEFFDSLGHKVIIFDPAPNDNPGYQVAKILKEAVKTAEIIILATPLSKTSDIIFELIELKPPGIIIDICSLKSPIKEALKKAVACNLKVASIHPMFGPGVKTLLGRNIILCQHKSHVPLEKIENLLASSSATIFKVPFESHDLLMSYVLGFSHLLNLVFAGVIRRSPFKFKDLLEVAGTTFRQQLSVTSDVISENQDLYFEIQSLNSQTPELINVFQKALNNYQKSILTGDRTHFKQEMQEAFNYFKEEN